MNGPLQQAYNLIFPDPILQQLRNLDDESFRDNKIIPNNSQIQTVIFVDKQALTQSLDELQIQLNQAANEQRPEAKTTEQEKLRAQINQSVLDDMRAAAAETAKDSTRPSLLELWWKGNSSPLLVKLALGNLVIVGDEIQYLQRVQVQSSSPTSGVAVTVSPANPSLNAKATQPFTATVTGTTTISVTWSVKCDATAKDACGKIDSSSGQYTAPDTPPDPSTVTVTATSTADNTKTGSTTITIIPALTFSTSSPLPAGKAGQPYPQQTISATGGNGAYTYTGGPPPPDGLSMNLVGAINGTPKTATGSTPATFTVTATDSSSPPRTGTATFSITITP